MWHKTLHLWGSKQSKGFVRGREFIAAETLGSNKEIDTGNGTLPAIRNRVLSFLTYGFGGAKSI